LDDSAALPPTLPAVSEVSALLCAPKGPTEAGRPYVTLCVKGNACTVHQSRGYETLCLG